MNAQKVAFVWNLFDFDIFTFLLVVTLYMEAQTGSPVTAHNIIAEVIGSQYPDEVHRVRVMCMRPCVWHAVCAVCMFWRPVLSCFFCPCSARTHRRNYVYTCLFGCMCVKTCAYTCEQVLFWVIFAFV